MKRMITILITAFIAFNTFGKDTLNVLFLVGTNPPPLHVQPVIDVFDSLGFTLTIEMISPTSATEGYDFAVIGEDIPSTDASLSRYSTAPLPLLVIKVHVVRPQGLGWAPAKGDNSPDSVILIEIDDHPVLTGVEIVGDQVQYCSGLNWAENENGCGWVTIPPVGGYDVIGEDADAEPDHHTLAAIAEGTDLRGNMLVNRAFILGYSHESFDGHLTEDGMKILENACYWVAGRQSPYYVSSLQHNSSAQALVYPSPSSGMVKMKLDQIMSSLIVKVSGIDGRVLLTKQYYNTGFEELDLSGLQAGIYFIHLEGSDFLYTERLIINKQ